MPVDISYDYIALYKTIDEMLPYKQYNSGARVEDNSLYQNKKVNTNPVLRLEYDILNKDGFGLKRGFYVIRPDSDYTYLMFIQSGKIKAKIPVIKNERISEYGNDYEWPDKKKRGKNSPNSNPARITEENTVVSPEKIIPKLTDKEKRRRERQFKKGIDPIEYIHSTVNMEYDKEIQSYVVIWEKYNTRIIGVLKIK